MRSQICVHVCSLAHAQIVAFSQAVADSGLSRLANWYVAGIQWLVSRGAAAVDGIYLDGIGHDRTTMKRSRKVLDHAPGRPRGLIDHHCGQSFWGPGGMVSCALTHMEHFAYIDSLWYGESFNYQSATSDHAGPNSTDQAYWLVEISGLPFGLWNDMLAQRIQWEPCFDSFSCTNPWRGMIYGMTARLNATDNAPIWQ